ncbi:hypothetical protein [Photorhabdus sp. RM71S]|uniref:hypothetical protein n=1 Tax=Photorhabdus sp. RM71S TaxID=3342824 RepID=UPI0036DF7AC3
MLNSLKPERSQYQKLGSFLNTLEQLPTWEKGALIAKEAVESADIGGAIGGKASVASIIEKNKQPYQPNQGAVGNMNEFLKQPDFGSQIKGNTQKTSKMYDGQSIYSAKSDIDKYIKKAIRFT